MSDPAKTAAPPPSEPAQRAETTPRGGQELNRRVMKALVIGPRITDNQTTGQSKEIPQDDFVGLIASNQLVEPPFDILTLEMMIENSTEMQACVEAMEINADGFGFRLDSMLHDVDGLPTELKKGASVEKNKLANFFNNCSLDDSFTGLRRKRRRDLEMTGNAYWEVIRQPAKPGAAYGDIDGFNHIPAHQIRLGVMEPEYTTYKRKKIQIQDDGTHKLVDETAFKRFRRFVQAKIGGFTRAFAQARGYKVRWFKEFMDPRVIDNESGDVVPPSKVANWDGKGNPMPEERRAAELIHFKLYSPRTPYGLPRYVGNLITLFGDRAADEINFITLRNNNIPSMVVTVSGGQLTQATVDRIQEFVEQQIQGSENYSRFLIMEGESQYEGTEPGQVRIDLKPLTDTQMRDQMFQNYGANNKGKIRRIWRLPPIFVGDSSDYNKATAQESRKLADEQVFKPERDEFDSFMNKHVLPNMGVLYHRFVSNGPDVTDDQDLIMVLAAGEKSGAITPAIARKIVGDIMKRELPPIDKSKLDPDVPYTLQVAEKVKNQAAMQTGGPEMGSQITAMKGLSRNEILASLILKRDTLEKQLDEALFGPAADEDPPEES